MRGEFEWGTRKKGFLEKKSRTSYREEGAASRGVDAKGRALREKRAITRSSGSS